MTRRTAFGLALSFLLLQSFAARSETVVLQTGEHPGFTRIVLDFAAPSAPNLSRTDDGYAVRISRADVRFDLSQSFRNIPRTRLGTVWVDPTSGLLQLGVACACHARLEHLGGDVLVIDLVDGPAPVGSPWELRADGYAAPPLQSFARARPRPRPPMALALPDLLAMGIPRPSLPVDPDQSALPLRDDLLIGFAEAAAAGLVDPAEEIRARKGRVSTNPQVGTRLGDLPQVAVQTAATPRPPLTAKGTECIADDRLAIETWGGDQPFATSAAAYNSALIGEFDRTNPDGLSSAVRFYLYHGFGAEAAALLEAFPNSLPDAPLWRQMAALVDGRNLPNRNEQPSLADQAPCNGKAALWAALSVPHPGNLPGLDRAAMRQAFSALPPHQRQLLGPRLVEALMNDGDMATARSVIDAIARAPAPEGPAERLMSADLATREGDAARGESIARAVLPDAGPEQLRALLTVVNAQLAQGNPVEPGLVEDLAAVTAEVGGGPLSVELARTRALAVASGGDYEQGFALAAPLAASVEVDLWEMLATRGSDSAILTFALSPDGAPAGLPPATRLHLAERLLALGFPEQALGWLPDGDTDGLLIASRARLFAGDARAALSLIAGKDGDEADGIRAAALMTLGDLAQAAATYERLGDDAGTLAALWQSQDWAAWLERAQSDEQQDVAQLLAPRPVFDLAGPSPLAQGRQLVVDAEATAKTIGTILASAPGP